MASVRYGTVTFWFEDESEDVIYEMTEKILAAVENAEPQIFERCSKSEDSGENEVD